MLQLRLSLVTEGKKEQRRWEKGKGGREREKERGREGCNIIFSVQDKERQFTTGGEQIQTSKEKNPTKQKTVTTGFYMVLVVAVHEKMESVMGKHPSALKSCFRVFLHQDDTEALSEKAKLPPLQTAHTRPLHHIRECKDLAMILHISPQEESQDRLKGVGSCHPLFAPEMA